MKKLIAVAACVAVFGARAEAFLPVPADYELLEYIEAPSNNADSDFEHNQDVEYAIDTGVIPKGNWKVDIEFTPTVVSKNRCLFMARTSTSANRFGVYINVGTSESANSRFDFGSGSTKLVGLKAYTKYRFIVDGASFSISTDDGVVAQTSSSQSPDFTAGTMTMSLLATCNWLAEKELRQRLHGAIGRLYSARIWDGDGKAVRLFVPCRRVEDGVAGLFDRVGRKFYPNDGMYGSFEGGAIARHSDPSVAGESFRCGTWNLGHFSFGKSTTSTIEASEVELLKTQYKNKLTAIAANWFGVCEYANWFDKDKKHETRTTLFDQYQNAIFGPNNSFQFNGVFSDDRFEVLGSVTNAFANHIQNTYFLANEVLIDGKNKTWMVQLHLDWQDPAVRAAQVREVVKAFGNAERVVLSGDFNSSLQDSYGEKRTCWEDYAILAEAGYNLANVSGPCTTKSDEPKYVLDQIAAKGFVVSNMKVYNGGKYSDHNAEACTLAVFPSFDNGKEVVAVPSSPVPGIWTGSPLEAGLAKDARYTVTCDKTICDAGAYTLIASLVDPEVSVWSDGTTTDKTYVYTVKMKADNILASLTSRCDGTPTAADLEFAPDDVSRRLYLAFGATDGGDRTNGWEYVVALRDVAEHIAKLKNVQLPTISREVKNLRFFLLPDTALDSTAYADMGSLLAQWDGIDNNGRGVHTEKPQSWRELVSGNLPTKTGTPVHEQNCVLFSVVSNSSLASFNMEVPGLQEALNGKAATVQMFLRPMATAKSTTGNIYFYQAGSKTASDSSKRPLALYGSLNSGKAFDRLPFLGTSSNMGDATITADDDRLEKDVLATVVVDGNGASLYLDDCTIPHHVNAGGGTAAAAGLFHIGRMGGNYGTMRAYAVRVYGKALSSTEIKQNLSVDRARFLSQSASSSTLPVSIRYGIVLRVD